MERPKLLKEHSGALGWAAIGAFVIAWDALAPETLSSAFARGRENRGGNALVVSALGITAAHLLDLIPEQLDPFDRAVGVLKHQVESCTE